MTNPFETNRHLRRIALPLSLLFVTFALSGCTVGYRYASYDDVVPSEDGDARLEATESVSQLGAVIDFRYLRLYLYGELGSFEGNVTDERGRTDKIREKRSSQWYGLELPLLTLWDFRQGCCTYPPFQNDRNAVELWISSSVEPSEPRFTADLGIVYYFSRYIGARLFAGVSSIDFDATTNGLDGTRSFSDLTAIGSTFGFTVTLPAGPWGLEILDELLDWDEAHREQHGGY